LGGAHYPVNFQFQGLILILQRSNAHRPANMLEYQLKILKF